MSGFKRRRWARNGGGGKAIAFAARVISPRKLGAAALLGAAAVGAYATLVEPRWIQVTRPRIRIPGLAPELAGLRIALLTDLHAGPRDLSLVRRAVRLTLAEKPHLVALTGDFAADDASGFAEVLQALVPLRAPLGVFAVPGNHEYQVGIVAWHAELRRHDHIVDLTNTAHTVSFRGRQVCIAGVDDFYRGTPRLDGLPPPAGRDLTVLLAHGPDQAEQVRRSGDAVDLVLSGHTHGGQVRLPGAGAVINSAEHEELYEAGLRQRPWTQVYTSRGLGTIHLPIRFMCRPEVAVLEVVPG